jgi:acyl-CoA thioester hydrolase
MQPFTSKVRVSYSDTDQMGFVHHSNYLKYYETGRWNLFRHLGMPYKKIEEEGFLLPVIDVQMQYLKPAFYDQVLTLETSLIAFKGAKLVLSYRLFNEEDEVINTARITLAFINTHSKKPCKPPEHLRDLWERHTLKSLQTTF